MQIEVVVLNYVVILMLVNGSADAVEMERPLYVKAKVIRFEKLVLLRFCSEAVKGWHIRHNTAISPHGHNHGFGQVESGDGEAAI